MSPPLATVTDPNNPETDAFWEGAAAGRLLLKYCQACGRPHFYPRSICPFCMSASTEWRESAGRGTIHAFSVQRRVTPARIIAWVNLEEGPSLLTAIVGCEPEEVSIDAPVHVDFSSLDDTGRVHPVFALSIPTEAKESPL